MQPRFFKPSPPLSIDLAAQATELRERAMRLLGSPERDALLHEADRLDRAARIDAYLNSNELKPPT